MVAGGVPESYKERQLCGFRERPGGTVANVPVLSSSPTPPTNAINGSSTHPHPSGISLVSYTGQKQGLLEVPRNTNYSQLKALPEVMSLGLK